VEVKKGKLVVRQRNCPIRASIADLLYLWAIDAPSNAKAHRQQALVEYSLMVGALTLARASRGGGIG